MDNVIIRSLYFQFRENLYNKIWCDYQFLELNPFFHLDIHPKQRIVIWLMSHKLVEKLQLNTPKLNFAN